MSEESRVVLVAGPGGVGKTSCARALFDLLAHAALLDIDHLATVEPFEVGTELSSLAVRNAAAVASNMIDVGFRQIVLAGGVDSQELIDGFRHNLPTDVSVYYFWLTANPEVLSTRRVLRSRDGADTDLPFHDFLNSLTPDPGELHGVDYHRLDTTEMNRGEAVEHIADHLRKMGFEFRTTAQ